MESDEKESHKISLSTGIKSNDKDAFDDLDLSF
jgi:hypothetical protein